jgi:peptide/nickel transport system substrate-binding protein
MELEKNPLYFRAAEGLPVYEHLVFHFTSDPFTEFLAGNCEIVPDFSGDLSLLINDADSGNLKLFVALGTLWEHLDFHSLPADLTGGFAGQTLAFQDVRVRQAFAYCIDRQAITTEVYGMFGAIANTYIPPSHPLYPPDLMVYPFNPNLGRALLTDSGWVDSNNDELRDKNGIKFSVSIITTDSALRSTVTDRIASQLLANCGIEAIPDQRPAVEVFSGWPDGPIYGRQFDLAEYAWITGVEPPCDLYQTGNIPSDANTAGQNNSGYRNPAYDAACYNALSSLSDSDRVYYHRQAIAMFTEDLPVLPLFLRPKVGFTVPGIAGFGLDPTAYALWNVEEIRPSPAALILYLPMTMGYFFSQ